MHTDAFQEQGESMRVIEAPVVKPDTSLDTSMFSSRGVQTGPSTQRQETSVEEREVGEVGLVSAMRRTSGKASAAIMPAVLGIIYAGLAIRDFTANKPVLGAMFLVCAGLWGLVAGMRAKQDA